MDILILVVGIAIVLLFFTARVIYHKLLVVFGDNNTKSGNKSKALQLYLKALKFNIGDKKAWPIMDRIRDLYKDSGFKDDELAKIRKDYSDIHNYVHVEMKKKMNQNKEAVKEINKEALTRYKEFMNQIPKL